MTRAIFGGVILIGAVLFVATRFHARYHVTKKMFYTALIGAIVAVSAVLFVLAINIFASSTTGVLERRTAALSVSVCGQTMQFANNSELTGRIGGPRLYIYNGSIVAQSVFVDERDDASLGGLFESLGGSISAGSLLVPEENIKVTPNLEPYIKVAPSGSSYLELSSTAACNEKSKSVPTVFVYQYKPSKNTFEQHRLSRPEKYIISAYDSENIRDCIVIVHGVASDITGETCGGYPAKYELGNVL